MADPSSARQEGPPRPEGPRPERVVEAHPSPSVGPPPTVAECGDRGTYNGVCWQGGISCRREVVIVIAVLVGLWLLRCVRPKLSPATP